MGGARCYVGQGELCDESALRCKGLCIREMGMEVGVGGSRVFTSPCLLFLGVCSLRQGLGQARFHRHLDLQGLQEDRCWGCLRDEHGAYPRELIQLCTFAPPLPLDSLYPTRYPPSTSLGLVWCMSW
jgi:hypothetical protein